jgi:hypothetical protein
MAAVNVYMPLADQRIGLAAYKPTLDRLGIGVTPFKDGADSVLLVSDHTAVSVGGHPAYMPVSSLEKTLNRDRLHETGLATLPTVVIAKPEDAPSGTLAKPRNSATGGWVHQPHLGFPVEDLDIHFSVGRSGDIHVIAAQRHKHLDTKKPAELRMATPDEYVGVCEQITAACKRLNITGGLHDIQFLYYQGAWCAIDWNPRAPQVYTQGLANKYPCLDAALAHMVGLPIPDVAPAVFVNRSYWASPIPASKRRLIESFGLLPRTDAKDKSGDFIRVNGVGATEAEVNAKFDAMEAAL